MTTRSQSSRAFLNASPHAMASDAAPSALRAVIYARVSSAAQRDRQTIASQLSTLPTFIASRGWILAKPAGTYVDEGRTAMEGFLSKRNIIIGIVGSFLSGLIFRGLHLHFPIGGLAGTIFVSFIGAIALLLVLRLILMAGLRRL